MATIKLYSYLTEDNDRVYLGIPLVVNRVKHGDIITNDENQYRLLVEDGRTGRLKHYVPNNCTVDRLNAAVIAEEVETREQRQTRIQTAVDAILSKAAQANEPSRHTVSDEEFSRYEGDAEAYHGLHW